MSTPKITKEERLKALDAIVGFSSKVVQRLNEIPQPPSMEDIVKGMCNDEVEGIWRYGSKRGKVIAEKELITRGIISKNKFIRFFQKNF